MRILKIFSILVLCLAQMPAFAETSVTQNIGGYLEETLTIESFFVDGTEFPCGTSATLEVKQKTIVNPSLNILDLSPLKIKIRTNTTDSIDITATFASLENPAYLFSTSALSMDPADETVNNPHDPVISGEFIPKIRVTPSAVAGTYDGQVVFTVNSI